LTSAAPIWVRSRTGMISSAYSGICDVTLLRCGDRHVLLDDLGRKPGCQIDIIVVGGKAARVDIIERRELGVSVGEDRTVGADVLLHLVERHRAGKLKGLVFRRKRNCLEADLGLDFGA